MRSNILTFNECMNLLCCPNCRSELNLSARALVCKNSMCAKSFPIVNNKPVLINEENSLFQISDYQNSYQEVLSADELDGWGKIKRTLENICGDSFSTNFAAEKCLEKLADLVFKNIDAPIILVVGCGIEGKGMNKILSNQSIRFINIDISPRSQATIFSDAHDIPLRDQSVEGVIIQAVLEHVINPNRCVEEIYRVLKKEGIVYSEIPFMQQVHEGRYDFTRFTHLGHRVLFKKYKEYDSGLVAGPGTALEWSYRYLLRCFSKTKIMKLIVRLTGFWIKYFDYLLRKSPGVLDAASCTFFFGVKSEKIFSEKEIVSKYRNV